MKRVVSLLLAIMMLAVCTVTAFAEATAPEYIYFQVPTQGDVRWANFGMIYCHIWSRTGGDIYGWQMKDEQCEDMGNGYWRYDISGISFDPESEYSLIFSNNNGSQTYNLNFTSLCKGDIVVCEGDTTVNPVDGEKTCAVARWLNNGDKVHPSIEVDSVGTTLNIDGVDPAEAETVWGESEGASYELPEVTVEEAEDPVDGADMITSAVQENQDGLDTSVATMWIIICCAVLACAIVSTVIYLARKNKKN